MKILFIGSVLFSRDCLLKMIEIGHSPIGVCTLEKSNFNSDHYDLSSICKENDIPYIYSSDLNSKESIKWIKSLCPEIIFCFGWSKLLKKELLNIPSKGVVGFHPSDLPMNRGRHPLIWALVLGLKETASTFFFMDEGADTGDIISKKKISINDNDNAHALYQKVTLSAINQLEDLINQFKTRKIKRLKQNNNSNSWRKRGIKDGKIDWRMSARSIHNLIRGLSYPYIGAHFEFEGKEVKVWESKIVEDKRINVEPGKVIQGNNKIIIKAGEDSIMLMKIDPVIKLNKGLYL